MTARHHTIEGVLPIRIVLAVTAFIAGASFCLAGDKWHSSPTFYYVNHLPIPWWVYGVTLIVAAICLVFKRTRPVGYLLGAIIYTFFAIGAWLAVLGGLHLHIFLLSFLNFPANTVSSFFAAGNLTTIAVLYWSAVRYAVYAQVDPDHVETYYKK